MTIRTAIRAVLAALLVLATVSPIGLAQTNPGTSPLSLAKGGTQGTLSDPNADRIFFWDDSAGHGEFLSVGSGLSLSGTTLSATGAGSGDVSGPASSTDNAAARFDGTTGKVLQDGAVTIGDTGDVAGVAKLTTTGAIELGNASDTTVARSGAGAVTVEGVGVALNSTSLTHTASTLELGAASDTTLARSGAGDITVEGNAVYRAGGTDVPVADGGTGASTAAGAATNLGLGTGDSPQFTAVNLGHASDTTFARVSAGTASIEGQNILTAATGQPLDADLTTLSTAFASASASGPAALAIHEDTDNGTNKVSVTAAASLTADRTFTLPNADSNPVQPLTCSGSDKVSAIGSDGTITCSADAGAGGGISNVVEDLTPQLGGDLDANLFDILFDNGTGIRDESDNEQLLFGTTASAVNYWLATNSATGGVQRLEAAGGDAAVAITLASKSTDPINLEVNGNIEAALDASSLSPGANDGNALGATSLGWADLHLATGGVVNWANGEVTIAETDADTLTVAGASAVSLGTSAAFTTGTIELGAASDTTIARVSGGTASIEGQNILTAATGQPLDADLTAFAANAYAANSTAAAYIDFAEDTDNGSNRVRLQGPASTADVTLTLQATAGTIYSSAGTDVALADGGTGASLSDPNADRVMFWDDSAGAVDWLTAAAPLTITTTTIDCAAATTSADGCSELATSAETETGTDTGRTVTPAGLLAAISGKQTISVSAGAMVAETTTGCASGSNETANGVMYQTYDCDGAGSLQEGVQFMFPAPKSWDESTITVRVDWTAASGSGDVIWLISCLAVSNDDPLNGTFGTEVSVTDTLTAAADLDQSPESAAVTCGGTPAEADDVWVRIQRDGDAAGDTLNSVDAKLIAARVLYGINAFTDD